MSMSVDQNVSFLERGKIVLVINMSVSSVKGSSVYRKNTVVSHYRKFQNHLVNLGLAVSADSVNFVFMFIEKSNDFFGSIFSWKIISGSVIEQIAQKNQTFCLLFTERIQKLPAVICGAMYI